MNELIQALEACLNKIDQGADINTVLSRYPELAEELRPILETALKAKGMSVSVPSPEVVRRNRAKLLEHAAGMREAKMAPIPQRLMSVPIRRVLIALMMVIVILISGTSLVRALSITLPGDTLYSVKRTWEDVLLFLTVDKDKHAALELEYGFKRLKEVHDLYDMGRSAEVEFAGYVTRRSGDEWRVSGITVFISPQTRLPDKQIQVGTAVRIKGQTNREGVVAARVELLPAGYKLPEVEDNELDGEDHGGTNQQSEGGPGEGLDSGTPGSIVTSTPNPGIGLEVITIEGVVTSASNDFVVVNGVVIDLRNVVITGTAHVGEVIKVEGYYDASGIFIAIKVQLINGSSGSGGIPPGNPNNGNNNDNSNGGKDNNDSNENDNVNSNDDTSHNDNENDSNKNKNGNGN
jgi:hypothetical protein